MTKETFGWVQIVRIGLVQAALGSIVVMTTSTLNRVMVVELALPALVPGLLVTLHHALQMLRPRWGYGSDQLSRRTPWIIGGMACLATGGTLAAVATYTMGSSFQLGLAIAVLGYGLIGIGAGAAGTSLLTMLSERVVPQRKPAAATVVWILMIFGFVATAGIVGHLLDPFSPARLVSVAVGVNIVAFLLSLVAVWGLEGVRPTEARAADHGPRGPFLATLASVWAEPQARRFTIFIFTSMLAYSAQDLILEPFAGATFGMTPGETTTLGGLQHAGVLVGMIIVALFGNLLESSRSGVLRGWMIAGCLGSSMALLSIAGGSTLWPVWMFKACVFALGLANGAFAAAAIGSMMALAGGEGRRDGTRIGLWGAAQAVAFGLGGLVGTAGVDLARFVFGSPALAYGSVFTLEAVAFTAAAIMAHSATRAPTAEPIRSTRTFNDVQRDASLATREGGLNAAV